VYGFLAGDDVLRFVAMLLNEVLDELGTPNDFIGHPGDDHFVLITNETIVQPVLQRLKERFTEEVPTHYNYVDRENGYLTTPNNDGAPHRSGLMTISAGVIRAGQQDFADIREITEAAAEARRLAR
jgi:GGDEF domain-containing protein